MIVYMDARKMSGQKTGVGHYANEIFEELSKRIELHPLYSLRLRGMFHLVAAMKIAYNRESVYYSPESLIVPAIVGKRASVTIHDLTPLTHATKHTLRNRIIHKLFISICVRRVGAIFVPTSAVADQMISYFPDARAKILVVEEGSRFKQSPKDPVIARPKRMLYVGTIEPRKNVRALLQGFIQANLPGWTLTIVGRMGWMRTIDQQEIQDLMRHPSVEYLGYVSEEELQNQYDRARIFLYPSQAEGFGLPVLEALANGVPCITSNDPALVEVGAGATVTFNLNEEPVQAIADALLKVAGDDHLAQVMADKGLVRAEYFSWSRAADLIASELKQLGEVDK
jgi:glycosyltransferase involved in cell wall biosynthesis